MSIWDDNNSKYGTFAEGTKTVSDTTARRWAKENRAKKRRSKSMVEQERNGTAPAIEDARPRRRQIAAPSRRPRSRPVATTTPAPSTTPVDAWAAGNALGANASLYV